MDVDWQAFVPNEVAQSLAHTCVSEQGEIKDRFHVIKIILFGKYNRLRYAGEFNLAQISMWVPRYLREERCEAIYTNSIYYHRVSPCSNLNIKKEFERV